MSNPGYQKHIFVCTHKRDSLDARASCGHAGSEKIKDYLKEKLKQLGLNKKIRANASGCLDYCAKGPAVVLYPEGTWYKLSSIEEADEFLEECILKNNVLEKLLLK